MIQELRYSIIKTKEQYHDYCDQLEYLLQSGQELNEEEIELLYLLIEKWDNANIKLPNYDPIELIKEIMSQNNLKAKDLASILNLSKGTVSKMLNYQTGISKESIRLLSEHFKISQEILNKPYSLIENVKKHIGKEL